MKKEDMLKTLTNLGLSEYESRAYVALARMGPSKAGSISEKSKVPQSKIYDVLEALMNKQLVEVFEGRPKEFRAISPEVTLKGMVANREWELKSLKEKVLTIGKLLKPMKEEEYVIEGVWTQKSKKRGEVLNRLASMLEHCTEYAYDVTRDFSFSSSYRRAVKSCKRKGVQLRVVCIGPIDEKNYYMAKWYEANNIPVRIFKTKIHPRILVVDGREVSIRLDHNAGSRFTFHSIWSGDPLLVKVFDTYIKNLWKMAKPINFSKIPVPSKV